jgi:hypothetical protein
MISYQYAYPTFAAAAPPGHRDPPVTNFARLGNTRTAGSGQSWARVMRYKALVYPGFGYYNSTTNISTSDVHEETSIYSDSFA